MDPSSHTNTITPVLPGHSPLLSLPPELRFEIYDHLGPWEPKSYPFGRLLVSSIDRRAPPAALMATCRHLHDEILTHFYNTVTFRVAKQMVPDAWSNYTDHTTVVAIRRVKKMELRLCWHDRYKNHSRPNSYITSGWLDDMIAFLLREARSLHTLAVSLTDLTSGEDWETNKTSIASLKGLAPRAVLCLGEVIAVDEETEAKLREQLQLYLKALNECKLLQ